LIFSPVDGSPFPANPTADNKVQETPITSFNLDKPNYNNDRQTGGDGFYDLYLELLYRFTKRSNYIYNKGTIWRLLFLNYQYQFSRKL
jgi:hypothetical protein